MEEKVYDMGEMWGNEKGGNMKGMGRRKGRKKGRVRVGKGGREG